MHSIFLHANSTARQIGDTATIAVASTPARIQSVPQENWPFWAKTVRKFNRPADSGIGDTLVHLMGESNSARFKKWFQRKFGKSCGCTGRQRWLNQKYPYA